MRPEYQQRLNIETLRDLPLEKDDLFILLDGAALPALQLIYQHDDAPQVDPLYRGTRHQQALEVSPSLYRPSAQSRFWDIQEQWRDAGIVISSDHSFDILAGHLRSLLSVRMPSGQLAYCRFYSPGLLKRLCGSLSEADLSDWFGPINGCLIHARQNREESWEYVAASEKTAARTADQEGWFQLRPEQLHAWQQEERQLYIERMARHFASSAQSSTAAGPLEETISIRVEQAEQAGLQLEDQIIHFLELALRFPVEMDSPNNCTLLADTSQPADHRLEQLEARLFGLQG
jgi:hypothetical protein